MSNLEYACFVGLIIVVGLIIMTPIQNNCVKVNQAKIDQAKQDIRQAQREKRIISGDDKT